MPMENRKRCGNTIRPARAAATVTALTDARRFGFANVEEAERYLDDILVRVRKGFDSKAHWLDSEWQELLRARLDENQKLLRR